MRYACGLLLMVACACGGGSSAPASTNGTSPLQDAAQQVLEECGVGSLGDFLALVEVFGGLLDPNETNPTQFMNIVVDTDMATVNWELDLDGDQLPDLIGSLQFTNEEGEPETAASVSLLAGGFDDLDQMIATLPDGTHLSVTIGRAEPPPFDIVLTFIILGGAVDSASGSATVHNVDEDCIAILEFADALLDDLIGDYPGVTLNISLVTGTGGVVGTIEFDGTHQARAEVTLGSEAEVFTFLIDLDTGAVTPAP